MIFATVTDLAQWLTDHNAEVRIKRERGHWVVKIETGDPLTDIHVQGSSITDALALAASGYEAAVLAKTLVPDGTSMITDEITARVRGGQK